MLAAMVSKHSTGGGLLSLLTRAAHHLGSRLADVARRHGLSHLEGHVLATLAEGGLIPLGGLARRAAVKQPTLTRVIDRMVQRGHVERLRDECDRRLRLVGITPAGLALIGALSAHCEGHEQRALVAFGDERRLALEALLRELLDEVAGPGELLPEVDSHCTPAIAVAAAPVHS